MANKIINLDELLPPDIVFVWSGDEYVIPGDLSVEQVFRLYDLFQETQKELADDDEGPIGARHVERLQAELLEMFKVRQPDMESLPFGMRGTAVVIQHILEQLNPPEKEQEGEESLPPTSRRGSTRATRSAPRKGKPPRSRGSQG